MTRAVTHSHPTEVATLLKVNASLTFDAFFITQFPKIVTMDSKELTTSYYQIIK